MVIKNQLISNSVYLFLNRIFDTLFFMLFWIILGKTLLPESYGVLSLATQIALLLSTLSTLGFGNTLKKMIPELTKKKQKNRIFYLISLSLKVALISSLVSSFGLIVFNLYFPHILKLSWNVVMLVVVSTVIMSLVNILGFVYFGFQNMRKMFLTKSAGGLTLVILASLFLLLDIGYLGQLFAFMVSFILVLLTRMDKRFLTYPKKLKIDNRIIFRYSMSAFIVLLFSTLFNYSQLIILTVMKTFETTGLFAVAMRIASVIPVIPMVFSNALFPIISGLSIDKKSKLKQSYLLSLVFRYSFFVVLPISLFMIIFSKYLILFFSSSAYLVATPLLPFLVIGGAFLGLSTQFLSSLYAIGKPEEYRNIYVIGTLLYLILAIILTYYLSAMGLAFSYMLSSILMFTITFTLIRKHLTIKFPIKDILKVLIGIFLSFLFLFFTMGLIPNLWVAGGFVILASSIYFLVLLRLNFYIKEDLKILDFIAEKTPIFKRQIIIFRNFLSKFVTKDYLD